MINASLQPAAAGDESRLWMPPRRLWKYQGAKIVGTTVIAAIFVGWLTIQWSSPAMRVLAGALLAMTLWVLIVSIRDDLIRSRGRQIFLHAGVLEIIAPQAAHSLPLHEIAWAQWREDDADAAGLWLFGRSGQPLAHLDTAFLADQSEARAFLRWARQRASLDFEVRWPAV